MLIPLIPKDPERNDFTCRDGEIDFVMESRATRPVENETSATASREDFHSIAAVSLTATHEMPTANIRIPLQSGDKPKAELMLSGQISRVDPETAERLTQAIVQKAAERLLDLSTDLRRQGVFILPFRVYTMLQTPDGNLSYPSPQAIALPTDHPPHPEITAAGTTDDTLTLALRFPVKPHRLTVSANTLQEGYSLHTFISYPLYIPDPKEMRGSIGSVRSASGGQATGIRFAFLSTSAIKASVAAPEKYYEMVGNERTGFRISSKAATPPDYSCYASVYGHVPPFPRASLLAPGDNVDADTDPMDWIADWVKGDCVKNAETAEGYLPASIPHKYWHSDGNDPYAHGNAVWPEGIDKAEILALAGSMGVSGGLLTRPMTFADDSVSRRHSEPRAIRTMQALGISGDAPALAVLYGSDDCVRWEPMRRFDPRVRTSVLTPPRLFWRLLILGNIRLIALNVDTTL